MLMLLFGLEVVKGEPRMNEEIILSMVNPYVKDGSITYDQFDGLFCVLSIIERRSGL